MLPPLLLESRALRRAKPISQVAGFCCQNLSSLPMAGLEPARACYGPTDFKSVASAISPHRQYHPESTSEVISFLARISFVQEIVQERPRSSGLTPINDIKAST